MTSSARVSIIIPAFNDQAGLSACLHAIAGQSYPADAIEVIAVDNDSTPPLSLDGTQAASVQLIRCLTPGSYAARNAGVRAANGTILAFTDADCMPDPDWIRAGVMALESRGVDSIIGGEVKFMPPSTRTATACYQLSVGFQQAENIKKRGFSATANLFCTRALFELVGPFNETLLSGGDREWAWRSRRAGHMVFFEPRAVVRTLPRTSFWSAIRQARRVAAGRYQLAKAKGDLASSDGLRPHRSSMESVSMLLRTPGLSVLERLRVIAVASAIKLVSVFERIRVRVGGAPERR